MYKGRFFIRDFPRTLIKSWGVHDIGFPYSGIYLFTGGQGTGKTLNMVQCVLDMVKEYPDAIIVSNIPLTIEGHEVYPYTGLQDFENYDNGIYGIIYVLDEIQSMYSSMQSKGVSDSNLYIWSQNRKNRRVILGTSQRYSRVAKPIREQTRYHYSMEGKILSNIYIYRCYDGYKYDDNGNYRDELPARWFSCPSLLAYNSYDTYGIVKWKGDRLND